MLLKRIIKPSSFTIIVLLFLRFNDTFQNNNYRRKHLSDINFRKVVMYFPLNFYSNTAFIAIKCLRKIHLRLIFSNGWNLKTSFTVQSPRILLISILSIVIYSLIEEQTCILGLKKVLDIVIHIVHYL